MAKGMYFGVNGQARRVKKIYYGVNGVPRKVKEIYYGVNGVPRLAWKGTVPGGLIVFTSSQMWTVPEGVYKVDIFCVGGGGCGGISNLKRRGAGGGGGGYTATVLGAATTPGASVPVIVGAGGTFADSGNGYGGVSSLGAICSVAGGYPGSIHTNYLYSQTSAGGSGGSGGGNGAFQTNSGAHSSFNGGEDGSNTYALFKYQGTIDDTTLDTYYDAKYMRGQKTTTRAFSEAGNTLYSGGGAGGGSWYSSDNSQLPSKPGGGGGGLGAAYSTAGALTTLGSSGTSNTGGGGGGMAYGQSSTTASGGSGLVIVRWAEQ
ncbi:hypothetical protein acsn021_01690 [Anaerocolumna cellulosilytica]|uniref:Glycine-rich domain-containing protein n=1 Tax=Anaerocolumna cellulosilytica TaxID=433286 RepID=A0A6S6QZS2_9FIRM|nr:hypothetical protein [Anaerocolumna cellulosilytica]MBB5197927.1 hypothetical protein [Anaerocolumna cellulosilytica]BCJ92600.1 hypothetical protein acsn021_01690 [Anaerocolumna cellulosilytica]